MSRTYNLTEEQLDFISFMKERVALHPELDDRLKACLGRLSGDSVEEPDKNNTECTYQHSPSKMVEFLSLFSRDDQFNFKWYTHKWDMLEEFKIEKELVDKQQSGNNSKLYPMAYPTVSGPAVNESTYHQVWNFINFKNNSEHPYKWCNTKLESIKYGWHSVLELSKSNPEIPVENLKLEDGHQFKDYIRMFKSVIEFRTDLEYNDRFSVLIKSRIKSELPKDFKITFNDEFKKVGYELNVYCDVVGVIKALKYICEWITKHKAISSEVNVDLKCEDSFYVLELTHVGSYFNNKKKLETPSGDFEALRKRLFSVCDFSMEGDLFVDGGSQSIIVKALDETTEMNIKGKGKEKEKKLTPPTITYSIDKLGGVKYKLKIYRK